MLLSLLSAQVWKGVDAGPGYLWIDRTRWPNKVNGVARKNPASAVCEAVRSVVCWHQARLVRGLVGSPPRFSH